MLPPVAMPLDAAMPISVVLLAGALPRAPHVSHADVRDAVRLDVETVAFVVLPADVLLDALFVHLEGVRGAVPLVTIPPDVVMLVPFAVLASVLIDERGEGRRPRRCPVAPGQGRAATSTGTQHARQALDEREELPQAMAVPLHLSRAMQRPLTATIMRPRLRRARRGSRRSRRCRRSRAGP